MKKSLALIASALLAFGFVSCGDDIFVLGNIPYEEFFENEADSFDALSSATVKVANGSLTYGTFHEKADSLENSTFSGITFPVKVSKSALEKSGFTEITDKSGEFDLTTTAKGKTTTLRYSGKQNLYQAKSHSYYVLSETPAYYKTATLKDGKISFGKIEGNAKTLPTLYIAQKADPKHTKGMEYAIFTDTVKTPLSFDDADTAQKLDGEELSSSSLNSVRAVIATTSDGKAYGLNLLKNVFRGSEFGFAGDSEVIGKSVTSLTFITEKGMYRATSFVLGTSEKVDGKTVVTFAENAVAAGEFAVAVK